MCHRLRQRHGDLVWKVRFRDDWLYLLLLLEFQSTIEPAMREMLAVTSAIAGAGMIADGASPAAAMALWWATWLRQPRPVAPSLPSKWATSSPSIWRPGP